MANRRVLVKRRKAARNIRRITRTMQLIATARFQAAFNRAMAGRPYMRKLAELVADIASAAEGLDHPLVGAREGVAASDLLVLTSTRGLCGGYNANVLRKAVEHLELLEAEGRAAEVRMVGKKGIAYFRFAGRPLAERITEIGETPRYEEVEGIANRLMARFVGGESGAAHIAYMRFVSASRQEPVVLRLLPVADPAAAERARQVPFEFSPPPREILDELLPTAVRAALYQAFTEAAVSEHVARMVAMKAATDAAEEMIKRLTQRYNRARQTAITMELLDIVGGANALA